MEDHEIAPWKISYKPNQTQFLHRFANILPKTINRSSYKDKSIHTQEQLCKQLNLKKQFSIPIIFRKKGQSTISYEAFSGKKLFNEIEKEVKLAPYPMQTQKDNSISGGRSSEDNAKMKLIDPPFQPSETIFNQDLRKSKLLKDIQKHQIKILLKPNKFQKDDYSSQNGCIFYKDCIKIIRQNYKQNMLPIKHRTMDQSGLEQQRRIGQDMKKSILNRKKFDSYFQKNGVISGFNERLSHNLIRNSGRQQIQGYRENVEQIKGKKKTKIKQNQIEKYNLFGLRKLLS